MKTPPPPVQSPPRRQTRGDRPTARSIPVDQRPWPLSLLDQAEREILEALGQSESLVQEALRETSRILASAEFKRVRDNARKFLAYVVGKKLIGKDDEIKETTIAVHVFGEPADYDTAISGKIRVAAGNLRKRLAHYYSTEGRNDPIGIKIPTGTYIPEIRDRRLLICICPFENWNLKGDQTYLCETATEDLAYQLARAGPIHTRRVQTLKVGVARGMYGVRGSLESREDVLWLNVVLSDLTTGRSVWSHRFTGRRYDLLKMLRQVTTAIVKALERDLQTKEPVIMRRAPRRADTSRQQESADATSRNSRTA